MEILIVESNLGLAEIWARHLERQGARVTCARTQAQAIGVLRSREVDAIVMNVMIDEGSAFAVADFASYRHPAARVVFVTGSSFFSDGSIFALAPNACAFLQTHTPPDDLASIVAHYAT